MRWLKALASNPRVPDRLSTGAVGLGRYSLVGIILWLGVFKFTAAEANAIEPLLSHSPVLSWLYLITDVRGASRIIGVTEIVIATLIALRRVSPALSALGSIGAIGMFLTTLSFLATTPGMFARVEWLIVPAGGGGFILKDLFLLGAAMLTAAEALEASGDASGTLSRGPAL
jgi:reactive chlorine resistance protein C